MSNLGLARLIRTFATSRERISLSVDSQMSIMTRIRQSPSNERAQWLVLAVLFLGTAVLTGLLSISPDRYFQPYFGRVPPLLVVSLASLIGGVSLRILRSHGFETYAKGESRNGLVFSATFATLFAVEAIIADFRIVFPRDLNVPLPQSLLFYPAMAYIAEITFHALPLLLFLVALGPLFNKRDPNRLVWVCIVLTSSLEPVFQMASTSAEKPFSSADVYVGLHVFAINLVQLYVFRRYDFVAMYSFRMVYYFYWHIVWGYMRLQVLF